MVAWSFPLFSLSCEEAGLCLARPVSGALPAGAWRDECRRGVPLSSVLYRGLVSRDRKPQRERDSSPATCRHLADSSSLSLPEGVQELQTSMTDTSDAVERPEIFDFFGVLKERTTDGSCGCQRKRLSACRVCSFEREVD